MARTISKNNDEAEIGNDTDINATEYYEETLESNIIPSNHEGVLPTLLNEPVNVDNDANQFTDNEITAIIESQYYIVENHNNISNSVFTLSHTESLTVEKPNNNNIVEPDIQTSTESDPALGHLHTQSSSEMLTHQSDTFASTVSEDHASEESSCVDDSHEDPNYSSSDDSSDSSSSDSATSDCTSNNSTPNAEAPMIHGNMIYTPPILTNEVDVAEISMDVDKETYMEIEPTPNLQMDDPSKPVPKKSKKRIAQPLEWKKIKTKMLRNSGQEYISSSKTLKKLKAREMRRPCGEKCLLKCTSNITEEERKMIFTRYWSLKDINKQRAFIAASIQLVVPKYPYAVPNKRRFNNSFYFDISEKRVKECNFFLKVQWTLTTVPYEQLSKKKNLVFFEDDQRGKHGKHKKVDPEIKADMRRHINSIPRVESHYLRAQTKREFIEGGKSLADIFEDYKQNCISQNRPYGNRVMFSPIFNMVYNISFFSPKKDQCELCTAFQLANNDGKESLRQRYDEHHQEKTFLEPKNQKIKKK
ncbi:hypothetical protein NQ314_021423 [Rhamnusium bicolor]|uniref:Uncharacterized protein n=1 Tax=Rhamnusium bicolor TaxID=1586634 RepID=A0AAV8WJ78_9CUCU|nr:hypothetical protein NQ314_021423 [Rhamnusium bicolor]